MSQSKDGTFKIWQKDLTKFNQFLAILEKGIFCTCGKKLGARFADMYEHDGGIDVPTEDTKQWVYVTCQRCQYQWSWTKILRRGKQLE